MSGPLSGVRVVEMSTFVAGPVTARLLADMGATVIKVERPEGDTWRETGKNYLPHRFSDQENPVFDIYNAGKRHIALNVKTEAGMEALHRLLETAQVFVTNTRPAALKRLGLDPETLRRKYPGLVYALLLGYGEEGPDAAMPAFDTSAFWARSGFLRDLSPLTEDYQPISPPSSVGDTVTAYNLLAQICAALIGRGTTGKGEYVSAGLYHTGIFTNGTMQIITQRPWGKVYPRTRQEVGAPGGCYCCADGEWLFIANGQLSVALPKMFRMIGREDLVTDPRFADRDARAENAEVFYQIFKDAYATKPLAEWLALAKEYDLPMVRMNHLSDVSEDPQAWANCYLEHMECPNGETVVMPSVPFRMESLGELRTRPADRVGAHTADVLAELGYDAPQIAAMEEAGAVYCAGKE